MARHANSSSRPAKTRRAPAPVAPAPRIGAPSRKREIFVCLFFALGLATVYGRMCAFDLISYDTSLFVLQNHFVNSGLTFSGLRWALLGIHGGYYIPLTILSHMLDCQVYGARPWGHLLTNLILHAANAMLLFLLLRRLTGAFWRSAFVAAVLAFHPLCVESVAWVVERKDLLSALFMFLALLAYEKYARAPSLGRYGLVLLAALLGMLSKPAVVTLPFVLLLLDFWPLRRMTASRAPASLPALLIEKIPFIALAAVFSFITIHQQAVDKTTPDLPLDFRLLMVPQHYAWYLGKMFWPFSLGILYPLNVVYPRPAAVFGAAALLILVSVAVLHQWRRRPFLAVGWFWFLGVLVPMAGFIQNSDHATADRFMYLAQIGLTLALAWGVADWVRAAGSRAARRVLTMGAPVLIALLMLRSAHQLSFWRNDMTLWQHTAQVAPENFNAYTNYGLLLEEAGRGGEAVDYLKKAYALRPTDVEAIVNLANCDALGNDPRAAMQLFEEGLKIAPDSGLLHLNLGIFYHEQNNLIEARKNLEQAARLDPEKSDAPLKLSDLCAEAGDARGRAEWLHVAEARAAAAYDTAAQREIEKRRAGN